MIKNYYNPIKFKVGGYRDWSDWLDSLVIPTNEWEEKEFFLETLGIKIELPDGIKMRYRYPEHPKLEDLLSFNKDDFYQRIKKERDTILKRNHAHGMVKPVGDIEIIVPDEEFVKSSIKIINGDPREEEYWNRFILEHIGAHEEAHALQYSGNYLLLIDFVKKNIGETDYSNEMYKFASDFNTFIKLYNKLCKTGKLMKEELNDLNIGENRILKINGDNGKEILESHADICSVAHLIRKGYLKVINPETTANEIVRENFRFDDLMKDFSFYIE